MNCNSYPALSDYFVDQGWDLNPDVNSYAFDMKVSLKKGGLDYENLADF